MMLAVIQPRTNLSALFPFGFLRIHHSHRHIDLFLGYFSGVDKVLAHTAVRGGTNVYDDEDNYNNNDIVIRDNKQ
jgi:hypothetical protein